MKPLTAKAQFKAAMHAHRSIMRDAFKCGREAYRSASRNTSVQVIAGYNVCCESLRKCESS